MSSILDLPHIELDSLKLRPGRTTAPPDEFGRAVLDAAAQDRWILDGNWTESDLVDAVWARTDAIVWVDFARWVVLLQVIPRSIKRAVMRTSLYGYGHTRLRDLFSPTHPIRWSWAMHGEYRDRYARMTSGRTVVRLTTRQAATRFVRGLVR